MAVLGAARRGCSLSLDVSGGDRTEVDRAGKAGATARGAGWREVVLQKKTRSDTKTGLWIKRQGNKETVVSDGDWWWVAVVVVCLVLVGRWL